VWLPLLKISLCALSDELRIKNSCLHGALIALQRTRSVDGGRGP
jgi:hypothetical protein